MLIIGDLPGNDSIPLCGVALKWELNVKITNFLCAEFVSEDSSGKITLVGACIDRVSVKAFPARFVFYLFARCVSEVNDVPGKKTAQLRLIGNDKLVGTQQIEFETREDAPNANLVTAVDFQTNQASKFRFELRVEGSQESASWPLEIFQA